MTDHVHSQSLLRILGLAFGIAVVVGGAVGQGIMRAPGIVASAVHSPLLILLLWGFCGVLALIDGLVVMELGAAIPCAGGPYAFSRRAFGSLAGTLTGWTDWFQGVLSIAFIAVVFGEYVHRLGFVTTIPREAISALLMVAILAVHWGGTRAGAASQIVGTALKGLALLVLIALLFTGPRATPAITAPLAATGPALGIAGLAIALRAIITTYSGWNASIYFCEELRDPARHVVRATFIGIVAITALYVLMNAAMLHVLSPAEMARSNLPAADALGRVLGPASSTTVTALALLSVAAIANLNVMVFTRTMFGLARDGDMPRALAGVARDGTPRLALVMTVVGALGFAVAGGYDALLAIALPPWMLINLVVDLAAIRLRRTEPGLERPFRMPLYPLPALVGALMNGLLIAAMVYEDPAHSIFGMVAVSVIGVIYAARSRLAHAVLPA
jgi:APA family basic amino acid/polyamine antiporter